jgi:hypothetical protein
VEKLMPHGIHIIEVDDGALREEEVFLVVVVVVVVETIVSQDKEGRVVVEGGLLGTVGP